MDIQMIQTTSILAFPIPSVAIPISIDGNLNDTDYLYISLPHPPSVAIPSKSSPSRLDANHDHRHVCTASSVNENNDYIHPVIESLGLWNRAGLFPSIYKQSSGNQHPITRGVSI